MPSVNPGTLNVALPSLIGAVYSLPSISIVTLPVASSGTVTVTVALSPTLISSTDTEIGASCFGLVAFEVVVAPSKLSSPEYVTLMSCSPGAASLMSIVALPSLIGAV